MEEFLELRKRPQKQLVKPCNPLNAVSIRVLELQTAKEILAETFRISVPEVEEMLQNRFKDASSPSVAGRRKDSGRGSSG